MSEVELSCPTRELRKLPGRNLKAIVLFGSRARGDQTERSDYDLFVIADELPDDPLDRARIIRSSLLRCPLHANFTARTRREFEERVGCISSARGAKREMVEGAIGRLPQRFRLADIHRVCPGVSYPTVKRALADLKNKKRIRSLGKGRDAEWERIGPVAR